MGTHRTINNVTWFLGENAPTKQCILEIQHNRVVKSIGSESESPEFKSRVYYLLSDRVSEFLCPPVFPSANEWHKYIPHIVWRNEWNHVCQILNKHIVRFQILGV